MNQLNFLDTVPQTPQWGFAGLTQIWGLSPETAYNQIVANLVEDPGALSLIETMLADPEGQQFMAESRQCWANLGFPPPWERARELLDQQETSNA